MTVRMKGQRYRRQRGVVFLTAMIALAVMFMIGMVFLQLAVSLSVQASREMRAVQAIATADAGVNYMLWNQKYPLESWKRIADTAILPASTAPLSLQPGAASPAKITLPPGWSNNPSSSCTVWLCRYTLPGSPLGLLDGYRIVSRATARNYLRTVQVIVRGTTVLPYILQPDSTAPPEMPVLNYALYSGTALNVTGNSDISGDVGCNLDLTVDSSAAKIRGNAVAGGRITTKSPSNIVGTRSEHQPQVILSEVIKLDSLYAYARVHGDEIYTGSRNFVGNEQVYNKVIYVKGNVDIAANTVFSGMVTIVAEGDITINGNVKSLGPEDRSNLFLITPRSVVVKLNGNAEIYSTIIAPGVNANYDGMGSAKIIGAVVGNSVRSTGAINIVYRRPNFEAVVAPPPPLQSEEIDSSLAWSVVAWKQLN